MPVLPTTESRIPLCHAGAEARVFSAQVEVSDELELIPTFAIAFSGCDLRCDFCITGEESWSARAGKPVNIQALAQAATNALADSARTVMFLGGEPTIHLPTALELVASLPDGAKLIWKTNAHGSAKARELLDGIFDVWLVDYKFGNDNCALRLARVPDYTRVVRENMLWAGSARGPRAFAGDPPDEFASSHREAHASEARPPQLIVRHLLMPAHVHCCWRPIAEWLAENLPGVKVNLRSGFWPAWHSSRHPELRGTVQKLETEQALRIASECGLNLIE